MLTTVIVALLVVAGAVIGAVVVVRARPAAGPVEANPLQPRLTVEVHAGDEQVLIHLVRSLRIASGRTDVAYGDVYLSASTDSTIRLASRSEIGRGFEGEVRVQRTRRSSLVEYFVLRLPADETVIARIARLDDEIAGALRFLDPAARVQGAGRGRRRAPALTPTAS